MEGHVLTESVQQLVALFQEMCCAGNGYAGQRVEGRGPDGQLNIQDASNELRGGTGRITANDSITVVGRRTVQGVVRAYFVRNHGDGSWIIAKGVLSRCASTALVLCIALSRVLR